MTTERTLRDVVALSTLPALWLGAEPLRIVESLATSLFTFLRADLVVVCLQSDAEHDPVAVAQTERLRTDEELARRLGPRLRDWARRHDPDEILELDVPGPGRLRVSTRPIGIDACYGFVAAGFADHTAPADVHHLLLGVAATQAATAIQSVALLRSLRRHTAQLAGLADATGAMLGGTRSLAETLQLVAERAREILGARRALVSLDRGSDAGQPIDALSLADVHGGDGAGAREAGAALAERVRREGRTLRQARAEDAGAPSWIGTPLVGSGGTSLGLIEVSDKARGDFTEHDETVLVQLARTAALVVEQRTAVAAQEAAVHEAQAARAEAEEANRTKDEFLAMLGHELRNPLAPIQTALQLIRLRDGREDERELTVIERQVRHLSRLVDDLLDVSRISRGKVQLDRRLLEVAEVVAKAIEMASPLVEQRRHLLEVDVPRAGLVVDGDPMRLAQVVSNLLTNAAKYTEPGGKVTVGATRAGRDVVLRVRDTGIGIAPEMLARIFDLFVQGQQTLDRSEGGLGLGLSIVRSLVTMHGGTVEVRSEGRGRGAEFTVRLPAARVPAVASEPRAPSELAAPVAAGVAANGRAGLRILVVDDNEDAADMLVVALRAKGHEVHVAYDGPRALELCARVRPQAALLDIGLPVMDGYELAGRLRELHGTDGLRLVAVTGYGQEADQRRSRAAGFDQHLVKPIDLEHLDRVLSAAHPA